MLKGSERKDKQDELETLKASGSKTKLKPLDFAWALAMRVVRTFTKPLN